ncbi:polysaccharide biosynthesis protein [Actinophytocola sp.]|uniref:lipopolysaccharide biosynthesis protein n=1 Tax=Actinophytocola sp. TaxID=1872138 RepID=UPI0025B8DE61|nr:polysaccharide biosynthesis protein [Actinophytocola sp.]
MARGGVVQRVRVAAVLVSVGVAGSQAASYLLNVVAARLLVPASFGELGSLLAVLVVGAVPAMGLQTVAALRVARLRQRGPLSTRDAGQLFSLGLATSAVVTTVVLGAAPLLVILLHLASVWPVVFVAASLMSITLIGLCYGVLQGTQRFTALAVLLAVEAVGRIGGTVVGLVLTRGATGALAATAIGAAVVATIGWVVCRRPRPAGAVTADVGGSIGGSRFPLAKRRSSRIPGCTWVDRQRRRREAGPSRDPANVGGHRTTHHKGHVGEVLHAVQAMLALVLLVNLDLVLARHHLDPHQAGEYAVGAVVTKIAYWLPQAVAILVLPRLASAQGRRTAIPWALGICAALDTVVVLAAATMGPTVVGIIGGADYRDAAIPIWPFAVVGSMLSLVQILLFSRIASADRRSTVLLWLAVAVEIGLVTTWLHDGLTQVVTAAVIATALLVLAGAAVELRSRRLEPVDAPGHDGGRGQQ